MSALLPLALRSLWNRRLVAGLTLLSITLAVTLLLGVEKVRTEARDGFYSAISGTDLIVGARSSPVQLLLHSVFRIGDPTANVSWDAYERFAAHPLVEWSVPLALGDAHRGVRVLGTTDAYLEHYRHGDDVPLALARGVWMEDLFDAVLGAEAARELGYGLGEEIVVAHGAHEVSFADHDAMPFTVVGILEATGTPVDRTIHVSLEAIEAIHLGWEAGVPLPGRTVTAAEARAAELAPETVSAFLLGLRTPAAVFQVQQAVARWPGEPLTAILPTVALAQFFRLVGVAEDALALVSAFVVLVGLAGLMTMVLASLSARRREMAILRSVGARPRHLLVLLLLEALALTGGGAVLGAALVQLMVAGAGPWLQEVAGVRFTAGWPTARELALLGAVVVGGTVAGLVPGALAYRRSLADGLRVRL